MDGSMGFMAVFAVSGSVALLALQLHKRLLSDFMKRIEYEFGYEKGQHKKRIQFIDEEEPPANYEKDSTILAKPCLKKSYMELEGTMPLNRLALYRGMIQNKMLHPKREYGVFRGTNVSHSHAHI